MAGKSRAQNEERHARARTLTKAHTEIKQRGHAEFLQEKLVTGVSRFVPYASMVERVGPKHFERRDGRRS